MQITRADGLVDREQAAALCGVDPDTISQWTSRGFLCPVTGQRRKLPVAKREGRRVFYHPVEVAKAEHATHVRARREIAPVAA